MNWITISWPMAVAACLTLSMIHLQIAFRLRGRARASHLFFTLSSAAVAAIGCLELALMNTRSLDAYRTLMLWAQVPIWLMLVSLVGFAWNFLERGNRWLARVSAGFTTLLVAVNYLVPEPMRIRHAVDIRTDGSLWGAGFTMPTIRSGWLAACEAAVVLLLIVFVAQSAWRTWRAGNRRRALWVGGGIVVFQFTTRAYAMLVETGVANTPFFFIFPFLMLLLAMGRELSLEVFRANDLAEQVLESERRMDLAARAATIGFWVWDIPRDDLWATGKARAMFGVSETERLTFDRFMGALHPDDREPVRQAVARALKTRQDYEMEYRLAPAGGPMRWISARGAAEYGPDGKPALMRGVVIDVTARRLSDAERQKLRAQLSHAGRISVMGQLASALAHELNQPLGAILSNAEAAELFLQRDPPACDEVRAALADIRRDDQRAGEVISRMRRLLKHRDMELAALDLGDVIGQTVALVRPDATARDIPVEVDVEEGLPPVRGDGVHLQQVLLNLIINGMDAMEAPAPDRRLTILARRFDPATVRVSVRDAGHGIPPDKLGDIMEPFYTTKSGGMGMGLPISKSIVEAHGGRLWAENNSLRGATFHFTLQAV